MSECAVEGCGEKVVSQVGPKDEYNLCGRHREAWGWFRLGYYGGQGFGVDGLVRKKIWYAAMKEFLERSRSEIIACTQIAESLLRSSEK